MAGSGYPMVASHDPVVIDAVPTLVREYGRSAADFEYQMLYGIRDDEQSRLGVKRQPGAGVPARPYRSGTATSCGGWPSDRPT